LLIVLAGIVQLCLGPARSGVTIDEPTQVERTISWLEGGDYVPASLAKTGNSLSSRYVYGPAFSVVAHTVNSVAGNETWETVSSGEEAVLDRHLLTALFALITALVAGVTVGLASGSRLVGLWTAAVLLAIPIWTGMGFFNPKDTPVAAGYTFFTASLILVLVSTRRSGRDGWRPGKWDVLIAGLAWAGVFFAVGTRLAMWLPLLLSTIVFACLACQAARSGEAGLRWPALFAGSLLGLFSLLILYPAAFAHPVEFIPNTLDNSSDYLWSGVTLTAGELLSEHPPWWYLPAWAFASIPLLIGLSALAGMFATLRALWSALKERSLTRKALEPEVCAALLILTQLLVLPLGSMVVGSTMYSGLRQHLYIVPAVAMLSGLGARFLLDWSRIRSQFAQWAVTGGLALAVLAPMTEQLMLFPYNYIYVNPAAGLAGINHRWEGDYWFSSLREASEKVPVGVPVYCGGVYPDRPFDPASLELCTNESRPYATQSQHDPPVAPGERWTLLERRGGARLPAVCSPVTEITRSLRGETIVLSWVARC